ncbi:hypothetical protein ACFL5E_02595 [Candidatus Omnitrophota bacterium]
MKYFKILLVVIMVLSIAVSAEAKWKGSESSKKGAGQRITDHTADAVADVLTGEGSSSNVQTKSRSKKVPPGHAKKGTTPHGWDQGKKTGWEKKGEDSGTKSDSPIKQMIRKMFRKKDQ